MKKMGKAASFRVEVLNKKQIEALKMGGLLAVNKGSQTPPTFTIMEYKPKKAINKKPIVLYGMHVDINREVQLLLFTFSIINIITIFASSIIIYLKQLPVLANGLGSNNSIAPPTTATTATTNTNTTTSAYNNKNM